MFRLAIVLSDPATKCCPFSLGSSRLDRRFAGSWRTVTGRSVQLISVGSRSGTGSSSIESVTTFEGPKWKALTLQLRCRADTILRTEQKGGGKPNIDKVAGTSDWYSSTSIHYWSTST